MPEKIVEILDRSFKFYGVFFFSWKTITLFNLHKHVDVESLARMWKQGLDGKQSPAKHKLTCCLKFKMLVNVTLGLQLLFVFLILGLALFGYRQ